MNLERSSPERPGAGYVGLSRTLRLGLAPPAVRVASRLALSRSTDLSTQIPAAINCRRGSRVNASAARKAPMPSENAPMKSHA